MKQWEPTVGYMYKYLTKLQGEPIDSLLDIGAAHGDFSLMFNEIFGAEIITMVEANPESCELLEDLPWTVINTAVGTPGKATFYLNPDDRIGGGSSLYKENTHWFDNPETFEVDVKALDDLKVQADFIKIDVQGAELDVLNNAEKTVSKAKYLLLELSLMEYNEGSPLIDDVLAKTREMGFVIMDIFGTHDGGHWYNGHKIQVDVLLGRKPYKMK